PAALAPPEPVTVELPPQRAATHVAAEAARPASSRGQSRKPRVVVVALAAVAILALAWIVAHLFRGHAAVPSPPAPGQELGPSPSGTAGVTPQGAAEVRPPVSAVSTSKPGRGGVATSPSGLHEEIPDVPWSARRTIRGHIRVWVRVIVAQDGSVFAA